MDHENSLRNRNFYPLCQRSLDGFRTRGVCSLDCANPFGGDVIPGSGGCRKVRWSRTGMGKRGGVRVIYFNGNDGRIWLLIAYAKAKFDNLPSHFLAKLKKEVERG